MEIILTSTESEKYFHNALCNEGGYLRSAGCEMDYKGSDYKKAKKSLEKKQKTGEFNDLICIEDVLVEILRVGGKLKVIDHEGDGAYTREITLTDVHTRVAKTPIRQLTDMIEEQDDVDTAFAILQTVFFEEVVFG